MTESTSPKPFAFVLMPFTADFDDAYELGIKEACREAGAYCERVDEQIFDDSILMRVYNQIAKADIVIADMSGKNANVFYETGYAHALDKRVILLTRSVDDIPFDLKHFPHVIYGGSITKLKEELTRRVAWCVANPKQSLESADLAFDILVNGQSLEESPTISCPYLGHVFHAARLEIQIHNIGRLTVPPLACSAGLIVPSNLWQLAADDSEFNFGPERKYYATGSLDEDWKMLDLPLTRPLLPGARCTFVLGVGRRGNWAVDARIRLFTELGPREYSMHLTCFNEEDSA